ncbi:hypothetical protein G7K_5014-t1 [Saitoella complicata NRRL Y-17804]|uniref:Uncharacterized protein n=1 Tax=Saitoella complicata (strain BCRC 22490 / CBS 7301 / JCM 7358 / NBRC 10748 / NRRL Y-17804) TaxID=698492 RepID=A0A0E9NNB9_SAICN|nr:hypothetical protein G7K_5014-t1 [Saitoella complicata NRRL Y-17804]
MSPIQWSKELIVQDHPASGDKIVLPPSALEEMLGGSSETNRELPSPLTFALLNPRTRKLTHSGLREFSAEEGVVLLPKHVRESLDLKEGELVAVAVRELSKGTLVKLRPLDAGYDEQDWKALLEARLNSHYTTLTKGEVLPIVAGNQTMQFLIDEIQPADAVLIVDTDLEVVLEPLDEQQAEETAKKRKLAVKENVVIEVGSAVQGQVERGQYANYELSEWSRDNGLVLEVKISNGDADLLVSTTPKPVDDLHMWSSFDSAKRVALSASNIELSTATKLYVSIHGDSDEPCSFTLTASNGDSSPSANGQVTGPPDPGNTQCPNCQTWVPERSIVLHENFCRRNNVKCNVCGIIMKRSEEKLHWHCDVIDCDGWGTHPDQIPKHREVYHIPKSCSCGAQLSSLPALAFHRATSCPEKLIMCRFCHTLQEQGDMTTLSAQDMLTGLTAHESVCGSRSAECQICGRRTTLKDAPAHARYHDMERLSKPKPEICRNINCARMKADNKLALCAICFGPLWTNAYDPTGSKLKSRVERRYYQQLMTGCGRDFCRNNKCATATGKALTMAEAAAIVKPIKEALMDISTPLEFCVDEGTTKRRILAEMVLDEDASYDIEWRIKAIDVEASNVANAQLWLERNAVKKAEA